MRRTERTYDVVGSFGGSRIDCKAKLSYERTQYEAPKTWKRIGIISRRVSTMSYESGLITLYKNRQGKMKFETYHDGNFYPLVS